jgi:hypothetical protein
MPTPADCLIEAGKLRDLASRARRMAAGLTQSSDRARLADYAGELERRAAELERQAAATSTRVVRQDQQQVQQQQQQQQQQAAPPVGDQK